MNVITYSLICYGLTAIISFLVIGVVLGINRIMSNGDKQNSQG